MVRIGTPGFHALLEWKRTFFIDGPQMNLNKKKYFMHLVIASVQCQTYRKTSERRSPTAFLTVNHVESQFVFKITCTDMLTKNKVLSHVTKAHTGKLIIRLSICNIPDPDLEYSRSGSRIFQIARSGIFQIDIPDYVKVCALLLRLRGLLHTVLLLARDES